MGDTERQRRQRGDPHASGDRNPLPSPTLQDAEARPGGMQRAARATAGRKRARR